MEEEIQVPGFNVSDEEGENQEQKDEEFNSDGENSEPLDPERVLEVAAQRVVKEKSKTSKYKNRLQELANESQRKDQINYELQMQLQEKERLLREREDELSKKSFHSQKLFEANMEAEEKDILTALKRAKEDGDIDREVSLSRDLARVKAEQSAFDVLNATQRGPASYQQDDQADDETTFTPYNQQNPYDYSPYEQPEQEPELPEEFSDFLDRNSWLNPQSPDFDEDLAKETDSVAREFNKRLKFNGRGDAIGTSSYYDALENYMRDKYNPPDEGQYQEPSHSSYSPGVSRNGSTMADSYRSRHGQGRNSVSLTPQEYRIARNLRIPDPTNPNGYLPSEKAIEAYAQNKHQFSKEKPTRNYLFSIE